ncbi:MAG TPA: hypothetical protein VH684_14430 [Xanthobacteraceae bacterium]|jgi:glycosyltransferase involved in cell wall biosynthesis
MRLILVAMNSQGLKTDVAIIEQVIRNHLSQVIELVTIVVPERITFQSAAENDRMISIPRSADAVIFLERIVDHTRLLSARHRILIPNLEWLMPSVAASIPRITEIWHKTRISEVTLAARFPGPGHSYLGFTSPDFSGCTPDFSRFIHLRGSSDQKQTEIVLAAWLKHPEWPQLSVHSYVNHRGFLHFPQWLEHGNIRFKYCWISEKDYRSEATGAGVHLCPSSVEGFGHYINEAKSMGALIVTTDAPPMNELVDETCSVLVSPVRTERQNFGVRHLIDAAGFEKAIAHVLKMPIELRISLGEKARSDYLLHRERFRSQLIAQLLRLAQT